MGDEQQQLFDSVAKAKDHYAVLGLPKFGALTESALKKVYMKFARHLHPDKCTLEGATKVFQKVMSWSLSPRAQRRSVRGLP